MIHLHMKHYTCRTVRSLSMNTNQQLLNPPQSSASASAMPCSKLKDGEDVDIPDYWTSAGAPVRPSRNKVVNKSIHFPKKVGWGT